jgi:catecholate siderophore receptor
LAARRQTFGVMFSGDEKMGRGTGSGIRSFAKAALKAAAFGASSLALSAQGAFAQEQAPDEQAFAQNESSPITVHGERIAPESPKFVAPLLDTPQTITVVDAKVIAEQNLLNLRDVLATLPGITFGAGEGGGGYGDSINLRGFNANNDISVDGVRDSAQYSRTDPFNLEQIEVMNGASSVYGGSGAVGGNINLVTKRPFSEDRTLIVGGAGTDEYGRVTIDANKTLGDDVAVRLNAMAHGNDVPGRDVESYERWGVAPSITFGLGSATRATLLYVHQEDDNIPQYGVPYALGAFNNGALPGIDSSTYFGYSNVDKQQITVDSATIIVEHDFNDDLRLRNLTRWQQVGQLAIVDPPQGTWCVAPGINPWTGVACAAPGTYLPSGPRGATRDTVNEILINQTDLTAEFKTGAAAHTLVVGVVFSDETYHLDNGNSLRNPLGALPNPVLPVMNIADPDNVYDGPVNFIRASYNDNEVQNKAVYAFDSIELGEHWEINAGLRFEQNEGLGQAATVAAPYPAPPAQPVVTLAAPTSNSEELFSYRAGLVYKPAANASLYIAYGNSATPSQSSVNGACTLTSATGTANCNVDPEEAVNYEIGGKWDALGGRMALTAAIFRNERTNFRVASGDPTVPQQQLDGQAVVNGLALGASGLINDHWSMFANYTYLDSEIVQNISDIAVGGGALDFQAGDPLPVTPKHSASFWTTYETPIGLSFGYGATYQGELTFNRASATAQLYYTEPYWVHRMMASYKLTERVTLQLNINNLFDEEYFERIRNNAGNGWATPGAARLAVLSAQYQF